MPGFLRSWCFSECAVHHLKSQFISRSAQIVPIHCEQPRKSPQFYGIVLQGTRRLKFTLICFGFGIFMEFFKQSAVVDDIKLEAQLLRECTIHQMGPRP